VIFAVVLLFLLLASFFDAVHMALVSVNRYRIKHLAEQHRPDATAVMRALSDPLVLPGTTLVGTNLAIIIASSAGALWALDHYGRWGPFWADVVLTPLTLVIAEILPKVYGRRHADALALRSIRVLYFFYYVLKGLTWAATETSRGLLRALGVEGGNPRFLFSRGELEALVSESEKAGSVEPEQGRILSSVFVFGETRVSEIMVPRTEIEAIDKTATLKEALVEFRRHGFSRMPVFEESLDRIVGTVHLFDLFRTSDWHQPVEGVLHPVLFAPEARKCDDLLKDMQMRNQHLAVVVDEYGGTAGLVSFEDVVEELVGEITDEHEEREQPVVPEPGGTFLADAQAKVHEVVEAVGRELPEGDYETLAGVLLEKLGRIPRTGEKVELPGLTVEVVAADRRRVKRVRLRPTPLPQEDDG